jgi:hypothetical protein
MTAADKAKARWGLEKVMRDAERRTRKVKQPDGATIAKRMFDAEGRKAKRLYEKRMAKERGDCRKLMGASQAAARRVP